tara:strand:- start:129 stop:944 length:816 start_codon:yes stop_codon:yes gene_type:complete
MDKQNQHKRYYFLAGLPRAGNTLFANIINQNPDMAVTSNSLLSESLGALSILKNEETFLNFKDGKSFDDMMVGVLPNYYSNWKQKYIIDRSPWGLKVNLNLLEKYCTNEIKIIVLVRDMLEVLASFVKFSNENPNFFLNKIAKTESEKCLYLTTTYNGRYGVVYQQYEGIKNLLLPQNIKYTHFIEYNDLVSDTTNVINSAYDFLGIDRFNHDLTKLEQFKINDISYDDSSLGGNLHEIRTSDISKNDYNVEDILSKETIEKYSNLNIWRN